MPKFFRSQELKDKMEKLYLFNYYLYIFLFIYLLFILYYSNKCTIIVRTKIAIYLTEC